MLQDCLVSGTVVRKPNSDLLLHLLSNPILRNEQFTGAILPSFPSKQSSWTSQSSSIMETQSFTARRSAANNLPTFSLPPPDHLSQLHKYPAYAPSSTTQPTPAIVSSVLTPPAGLASDGSSVNSGSSGSSAGGVPPYQPMGYWPTPNQPSYSSFSSAPPMPASFAGQQPYMGRPLYSPSMNFPNRSTNSPTAGEGLPPPPYDINLPPFSTPMSGGGGQAHNQSLPNLAPQHQHQPQQQNQNHQQQHGGQHQQQLSSNNGLPAASQPPQHSPLHAPDSYGRPPPTPGSYYTPASTPQQSSFPAFAQQSPPQQSPNTSSAPSNRISPVSAQSHSSMAAPQSYHNRPYSGYNLPAMAGPIMSNVHNPGNQMALVGGMNMQGYPQHPHQMYGHHPQGAAPPNDRPFKCDQCTQSFNRNHDLKRHKRIHLAVKPFPCGHCEKSFSRKDALKRHILVKGCGKGTAGAANTAGGSQSPVDKSEVMSDSTEDNSPELMKKELS